MLRVSGVIFILIAMLSVSTHSTACEVAPDYHAGEIGHSDVSVRNIFADSTKIFLGNINAIRENGKASISVEKTFKPSHPICLDHNELIGFKDVSQVFGVAGLDSTRSESTAELEKLIQFHSHKTQASASMRTGGWGGILAGLHHGVDCRRRALLFTEQTYIFFLDENSFVQALFSLDWSSRHTLQNLENILSIQEASVGVADPGYKQ